VEKLNGLKVAVEVLKMAVDINSKITVHSKLIANTLSISSNMAVFKGLNGMNFAVIGIVHWH
jgi:hypothetical protein